MKKSSRTLPMIVLALLAGVVIGVGAEATRAMGSAALDFVPLLRRSSA